MTSFRMTGWVEQDGTRLSPETVEKIIRTEPKKVCTFGGEFALSYNTCHARDHYGIIQGLVSKGTLVCNGHVVCSIDPNPAPCSLEEAIVTAIELRSDQGIMALSGGVDSSLVAAIARRECLTVGMEGSHDLARGKYAAQVLDLPWTGVEISSKNIEDALPSVLGVIPKKDPVNTGIALTMYFVAQWAGDHGYQRILAGQGADELFGGYARYLTSTSLEDDLARDVVGLEMQAMRDQAVAALNGTYLSMPYLDVRVVRAAAGIPAYEKVKNGNRKIPLQNVAKKFIPEDLACYKKKAMQYGSGVWSELKKLARKNGYKSSVQDYIDHIEQVEHGH